MVRVASEKRTVKSLRGEAKSLGLKGYSRLKKADLVAAIRAHLTPQIEAQSAFTVQQLRAKAKELGISRCSSFAKAELIQVIDQAASRPSPHIGKSIRKTVRELRKEAKLLGVTGYSRMKRHELMRLIRGAANAELESLHVETLQVGFPSLVAANGASFGAVHPLSALGRTTIGRNDKNDIVVHDMLASRSHAEILFVDNAWHIRDSNSRNGTRLNESFSRSHVLTDGDEVIIGSTKFRFEISDTPPLVLSNTIRMEYLQSLSSESGADDEIDRLTSDETDTFYSDGQPEIDQPARDAAIIQQFTMSILRYTDSADISNLAVDVLYNRLNVDATAFDWLGRDTCNVSNGIGNLTFLRRVSSEMTKRAVNSRACIRGVVAQTGEHVVAVPIVSGKTHILGVVHAVRADYFSSSDVEVSVQICGLMGLALVRAISECDSSHNDGDLTVIPSLRVVVLSAAADESWRTQLCKHMNILTLNGSVRVWHSGLVPLGQEQETIIKEEIAAADVIVVLVSPDLLASRDCMAIVHMASSDGKSMIVPVIVKFCGWKQTLLGRLQCLPRNQRPISSWRIRDAAFEEVVMEIRALHKGAVGLTGDTLVRL